jgi:1-acyl-sn-glycerol-3-phosphate acyltransferase
MAALRAHLFAAFMAVLTGVMGLAFLPALADRRAARAITRLWAKINLAALALLCGVRYRIDGVEHMPSGPAIVAANHQSQWETIALLALLPRPAMVLKKELVRIPVYGWWAARTGVPVDRGAGSKALRLLRRRTEIHIARGDQIVVFPEGTRGPPGKLGDLQPGVAGMYLVANAPVTPVVHNSGEYWRHPGPAIVPGEITLRFLPPIPPNQPRKAFMPALETALRRNIEVEAA